MSNSCILTVNGVSIPANRGETLLDAALRGRVVIPQDCCTGQCNTCRVQVLSGAVDDQGTAINDMVLGCTATLEGDAVIVFDEVPAVVKRNGVVSSLRAISPEIWEVLVSLDAPLEYLAGQYVGLTFAGFPSRDYSVTVYEDATYDPLTLVFQIKRYEGGLISSAIGEKITTGHKVKVSGPNGHAFFREGEGRLVLVGAGTGWAPIWAVAREAKIANPDREIAIVIGASHAANLYMGNSLLWLAEHGVKDMVVCASRSGFGGVVKKGRPTDFIPALKKGDMVYACGVPEMVDAVVKIASNAGVTCYADPFTLSSKGLTVFNRITQAMYKPVPAPNVLAPGNRATASYMPIAKRGMTGLTPTPPRQSPKDRASATRMVR
jgi:NAD(P)H-flavin reductase/ferredoxin